MHLHHLSTRHSASARVFAECGTDDHHPIIAAQRRQRNEPQEFNGPVTQHHLFRFNTISQREPGAQARLVIRPRSWRVGQSDMLVRYPRSMASLHQG